MFPLEDIDDAENLILLCGIHHKMVDDQSSTYTVESLRDIKNTHEAWVSSTLSGERTDEPVRIQRISGNAPSHLVRLTSGQDLAKVVGSALAFSFEHDDPQTDTEVELLSGFLQEAQDWGELWPDLDAGGRVRAAHRMNTLVHELEAAAFWVFGGTEVQILKGGVGTPSEFPVAILRVIRTTNAEIIKIDPRPKGTNARAKPK